MESLARLATLTCNGDVVACSAVKTRGLLDETSKQIVEEVLEVDYSKGCTTLYKMIEEQDWESIVKFLETGYWIGSLFRDKVPPKEQAKTWVTRFDPENPSQIKWSQLPLHLAVVIGAPLAVVRRLVEAYPKALKCTDDEHMLPFHLAMRHGATDEVVDYLLAGFPDAVNVKGKNNRSALECAMRSRKKARARMLTIFLDKTRGKEAADLEVVRSQLTERNRYLDQLHMQLSAIETAKTQAEDELASKITQLLDTKAELESKLEELRHEKDTLELSSAKLAGQMQHTKLFHEIETERKIAALEAQKMELEAAERQIQEDDARLHSNLAVIEKRVGRSMAANDMDALKNDISTFQTYRLEHTRSRALDDIKTLKMTIQYELEKCSGAHKDDIIAIQNAVLKLEEFDASDASDEDLVEMKAELDRLKTDLRRKKEAQELRADLTNLKTSLELQMDAFYFRDKDTTAALEEAIESLHPMKLDQLEYTGLVQLRKRVTQLKIEVQAKELLNQAKKDLTEVQTLLAENIKSAGSKLRKELVEKKKAIDSIEKAGLEGKSSEELVSLQIELINLKEGLKRDGASAQKKELVAALKSDIASELAVASGKNKQTLNAMKKEIDGLDKTNDYSGIRLDALTRHRQSLEMMKKQRLEAKQIKAELDQLLKLVTAQMKQCASGAQSELAGFHRDLEQMSSQKPEEMSRIEIEAIKANIRSIKDKVSDTKEESITKFEFESLKQALDQRITSSNGETKQEFITMKQALDGINLETIQVKGSEGWRQLKTEIEALKLDLLRKDLLVMKKALNDELKASKDAKRDEHLQRASNAIVLEDILSASLGVLLTMKKDAEKYKSQATGTKKSFFRNFFRRNKKQPVQPAADSAAAATAPVFAEPDIQPIMPPSAPTADEVSHTSSEPDSESNSTSSVPKTIRTVSYGNVSIKSVTNAESLKSPSTVASERKSVSSGRLPPTVMVEQ